MSTDKENKGTELQFGELLAKMDEHLTPDLIRLIDLSYKLPKKESENIKVITSDSTSAYNQFNV